MINEPCSTGQTVTFVHFFELALQDTEVVGVLHKYLGIYFKVTVHLQIALVKVLYLELQIHLINSKYFSRGFSNMQASHQLYNNKIVTFMGL